MKFVVIFCTGETRIEEADTMMEVVENHTWKYEGNLISVTRLTEEET